MKDDTSFRNWSSQMMHGAAQEILDAFGSRSVLTRVLEDTAAARLRTLLKARNTHARYSADDLLFVWDCLSRMFKAIMPIGASASEDPEEVIGGIVRRLSDIRRSLDDAETVYLSRFGQLSSLIRTRINQVKLRVAAISEQFSTAPFGTVESVRMRVSENKAMLAELDELCDILRTSGAATEDLDRTLARAADEMQRRKKKKALALDIQHFTDYRQYVDLIIEIRRNGKEYVPIGGRGLSTGERVGVIFLCLMMTASAWEDQQAHETGIGPTALRLFLLDEALQLDSRSIATLSQFAKKNGARVIMASPTEASVPGNVTAYTIVRREGAGTGMSESEVSCILPRGRTITDD